MNAREKISKKPTKGLRVDIGDLELCFELNF